MVSSEMLLREIEERYEHAQEMRKSFFKTHWTWEKFGYICTSALVGICLLGFLAIANGSPIRHSTMVLISLVVIAGIGAILIGLILFKECHISAQFKKEFPEESKLLSRI